MLLAHFIYLLACAVLALSLPAHLVSGHAGLFVLIGIIGAWRYGWALTNVIRALLYIHAAYPRMKRRARAAYRRRRSAHAYFLVTSYRIEATTSIRVYRAVFEAATASPGGATVVASVVDAADERLVRGIFAGSVQPGRGVHLLVDRIAGTGKRDALAASLRTIRDLGPAKSDIVVVVDGDTCVPTDIVSEAAPFFTDDEIGALTTDETADIPAGLFADWYRLRFTQRHMMMSSMALGGRVLTLTGRMSVFRATLATEAGLIRSIEQDHIDHWRLGRIRFLTGDDKSTWFFVLSHGYRMAYLPDVRSVSMETQPHPSFLASSVTLMTRWFGNMLRINGRALRLSPRRIGFFAWWSILDQKVSIWTTLAGPIGALLATLFVDPLVLPAYAAWVMITRYATCSVLRLFRPGGFPITHPFLLYFSQVFGSLIKSFVLFHLDRQKWTRQAAPAGASGWRDAMRALSSGYLHALAFSWLLVALMLMTGLSPRY